MANKDDSTPVNQPPGYSERLASISNAQIVSFLEKNTTNHICPCCGQNSWGVVNSQHDFTGMLAIPKSGGMAMPPPMIPLAIVSCQNCGYIKSFALSKVLEKTENASK